MPSTMRQRSRAAAPHGSGLFSLGARRRKTSRSTGNSRPVSRTSTSSIGVSATITSRSVAAAALAFSAGVVWMNSTSAILGGDGRLVDDLLILDPPLHLFVHARLAARRPLTRRSASSTPSSAPGFARTRRRSPRPGDAVPLDRRKAAVATAQTWPVLRHCLRDVGPV